MVGLNLVKTLVVPEVGEQLGLSVNLACLPLLNLQHEKAFPKVIFFFIAEMILFARGESRGERK